VYVFKLISINNNYRVVDLYYKYDMNALTIIVAVLFLISHWCLSFIVSQRNIAIDVRAPIFRSEYFTNLSNIFFLILILLFSIYLIINNWILWLVILIVGFPSYVIGVTIARPIVNILFEIVEGRFK